MFIRAGFAQMAFSQERYWYVQVCLGTTGRRGEPRWVRRGPDFHDAVLAFNYGRRLLERHPPPHAGATPDTVRVVQVWRNKELRHTLEP